METKDTRKLFVVPTPLGNFEDVSYRVINTLKNSDIIACEDTRETGKLLKHFDIKTRLISYHMHNEEKRSLDLLSLLGEGKVISLVSDAGMPGISDPGHVLIKKAIEEGIDISVLPGPSAFVTALVGSGLPTDRFTFIGFLDKNRSKRKKELEEIKNRAETLILYEAPHRLLEFLNTLKDILGDREVALCRELTKVYEEYERGSLSKIIDIYQSKQPRGEYVVIVSGASKEDIERENMRAFEDLSIEDHVLYLIKNGAKKKDAIKEVARVRNLNKNEVYMKVLNLEEV